MLSILCGALAVNDNYFKNCDFIVQLSENEGTSVINRGGFLSILGFFGYMGFFKPGSSCRYVVKVPDNYIVKIYCDIDIAITVSMITFDWNKKRNNHFLLIRILYKGSYNTCATEQFRVLADGTNAIMARGAFYCGKGVFAYASTNNIIAFGS